VLTDEKGEQWSARSVIIFTFSKFEHQNDDQKNSTMTMTTREKTVAPIPLQNGLQAAIYHLAVWGNGRTKQ
jgi:hypothetical protein